MTPGGQLAIVLAILSAVGVAVTAWVALATMRHNFAKEKDALIKEQHNQLRVHRIYADEIGRYLDRLRRHLREKAESGAIDITQLDLSLFVPPDPPKYNGD